MQDTLKKKLYLSVDQLKVGFGNSNKSNTALRFFENTEVSARLSDVDKD